MTHNNFGLDLGAKTMAGLFGMEGLGMQTLSIGNFAAMESKSQGHLVPKGPGQFDIVPFRSPQDCQVRHPHLSQPLERSECDYLNVLEYVRMSSATKHDCRLVIRSLQKVTSTPTHCNVNNRVMLWHGTPRNNVSEILSSGFSVEKASAGGMYGSGVYFADCVTKSFQYCEGSVGVLFLCEVALGDLHPMTSAGNGIKAPPPGHDSVMGVGNVALNGSKEVDGVVWPHGILQRQLIGMAVEFNEFTVYNADQITLRYVVTVERV